MRPSTPPAGPEIPPSAPERDGAGLSNAEQPWDDFDTLSYLDHNYRKLRDDDQHILRLLRDFFGGQPLRDGRGIDVGAGANLYPAMSVLPLCADVTLWEKSANNVEWLQRQVMGYEPSWDQFWRELAEHPRYAALTNPRLTLADRVHVRRGDVFQLPTSVWDVGTMFFVAESISALRSEFEASLHAFLHGLRAGSPFAAAFMENSHGYTVGFRHFPAVAVGVDDVADSLAGVAHNVDIQRIGTDDPLREGYDGMILAVGVAGQRRGA
jgi:hypothetical protein